MRGQRDKGKIDGRTEKHNEGSLTERERERERERESDQNSRAKKRCREEREMEEGKRRVKGKY